MNYSFRIFILAFMITLFACEDKIEVDNEFVQSLVVVDAWLTNDNSTQTIKLSYSQDYFKNEIPDPIEDAEIYLKNQDEIFRFQDVGFGNYSWQPIEDQTIGSVDDSLQLFIEINDIQYNASTKIHRVAKIDSISIYYEEQPFGGDEGLYAQVYAKDHVGIGDSYWVKAYRNDTLLNRPQEINIVFDASFNSGTDLDGVYFIFPKRFGINALDDDFIPRQLKSGDKVGVEIHSISNDAFNFLQIAMEQSTNGDNTIFAQPIANTQSNISASNGNQVLGFFNVAAVSIDSKTVK